MQNAFNTVAQGLKDTINGFDIKPARAALHTVITGLMAVQAISIGPSLSIGFALSAAIAGYGFHQAHEQGKYRRQSGYPPRWIK